MTRFSVVLRPRPPVPAPPGAARPADGRCTATTKAGKPCTGRAGTDGRCAAHKER